MKREIMKMTGWLTGVRESKRGSPEASERECEEIKEVTASNESLSSLKCLLILSHHILHISPKQSLSACSG